MSSLAITRIEHNVKLRKKVLAVDMNLEDMVKMGLVNEQTQIKADQMAGNGTSNREGALVRRVIQEEVKRLNLAPSKGGEETKTKCQTCTRSHNASVQLSW